MIPLIALTLLGSILFMTMESSEFLLEELPMIVEIRRFASPINTLAKYRIKSFGEFFESANLQSAIGMYSPCPT